MTLSSEYLHDTACGLQDPDHWIADEFVQVLEDAADRLKRHEDSVEETCVAAAGCGSCFHTDADVVFYWVAQNDMGDTAHINYGRTSELPIGFSRLMDALKDAAKVNGVPISIPDSDSYTVVLGTDAYYENLEPGTRVEKPRRYGDGKEGVVLNSDSYNPRMDYRVYDQDDYDGIGCGGDTIGEFPTREDANDYADQQDCETHVGFIRKHGFRDGENLVQWFGDSKPDVVKTMDVVVLD